MQEYTSTNLHFVTRAFTTFIRLSPYIQASVLQLWPALVKGGVLVSVATAQWEEVTGFISPLSR